MFEIGNSLREARVRQGLDYTEIELATKVRAKYLHALEDEQFDVLPALRLTGVGKGTYVEVRRRSPTGSVLLQATIGRGKVKLVDGSRFWLYVRRPSRVRVTLGGKAVALPARRNLRVLVTPTRTARAPTS